MTNLDTASIAFCCGGTGGHIYPAIAVAQGLQANNVIFFGTPTREDSKIIPKYGYTYYPYAYEGLHPIKVLRSWGAIYKKLKQHDIKLLVCTGGRATVWVAFVAWRLGIPIMVLEQNAIPGRTNLLLSRIAKKVAISYENSRSFFPKGKTVLTGNPIRQSNPVSTADQPATQCVDFTQITWAHERTLMIFGGSQASQFINTLIHTHKQELIDMKWNIIWICGPAWFKEHKFPDNGVGAITAEATDVQPLKQSSTPVTALILSYLENMSDAYTHSHAVMCRAGASTLAELAHYALPACLIPYPYAKDNHQVINAQYFVKDHPNQSMYIEENSLDWPSIKTWLHSLTLSKTHIKTPHTAQADVLKQIQLIIEV